MLLKFGEGDLDGLGEDAQMRVIMLIGYPRGTICFCRRQPA